PFVQILELGNFSVTYRIAGFLADVKRLITSRSSLRAHVLDTLHRAGVEIVSPTFMVQRPQLAGSRVLAPTSAAEAPAAERSAAAPEDLIFDKAEEAASLEELRGERERLLAEIAALEDRVGSVEAGERARVEREVELRRLRVANLEKRLAVAETSSKGAPNGERA
ncbi:MAG: hypothetical protein OEM49_11070, partial [Myxococcales bacterium]|nr:hypothetical protein [Myxococcales bacterium]